MSAPLLVAVDGGNSKTDVILADGDGTVLAAVRGPTSSPHNIGVPGTIALLGDLVQRVRKEAGLAPDVPLDRAEIYLAGADLPVEVATLMAAVGEAGWAVEHRVDNDLFALLRAGTDHPDAIAVVCGAGINCLGRTEAGAYARFPALGPVSGDWGGGHHLAQLALWHAVRGEDGRGPGTALVDAVARHFGLPTVEDVGIALHFGDIPGDRLTELTPILFEVAAGGDGVAACVVQRQAEEIVSLASVAAGRLGLRNRPVDVVLGGGVLRARHPMLHEAVVAGLAVEVPRARPTVLDAAPVTGAVLLGLDALGASPAAKAAARHSILNSRSR
ncbi:N-acetylglucosamine kinase-like BadF-type ATPase [Hamadaea flava]|uniref:N-acetylglucosamine kinase n=1 Tax=Hamadaea flava TaxID=1742688 RepID=A0ABV8M1X1_9ACTN|nr:BadF/BadG/BcrA/BcrD ATPase family protein [Hamadaea flava]MCP2326724.1 N-acetylglucosamine kinase-like BadF-type ATPase [Hamadaea flava]